MLRTKVIKWGDDISVEISEASAMQALRAAKEVRNVLQVIFPDEYAEVEKDPNKTIANMRVSGLEWKYANFIGDALIHTKSVTGFDFPSVTDEDAIRKAWQALEVIPHGLFDKWRDGLKEINDPPGDPDLAPDVDNAKKKHLTLSPSANGLGDT